MTAATAPSDAERPRYVERQLLGAAELDAEQAYLIAMRRRHVAGQHSWGIVRGLAPAVGQAAIALQPGVAVDGFGRELVVPAGVAVPVDAFAELGTDQLALWLVYGRLPADGGARGRRRCGPGLNTRWVERPCLRLAPRPQDGVDATAPPGVTQTDRQRMPAGDPPDAPVPEWPVFLGAISRSDGVLSVDLSGRHYAGAVGERVTDPRGTCAVGVGGPRGAVTVEALGADGRAVTAIDVGAEVTVRADTTLTDELLIRASQGTARGLAFRTPLPTPVAARPWSAYRTQPQATRTDELRLEMAAPPAGGDPTSVAAALGRLSAGRFDACLRVTGDCNVAIGGTLEVGGRLVEGPLQLDLDDPRVAGLLVSQYLTGVAQGASTMTTVFGAAVTIGLAAPLTTTPSTIDYTALQVTNPGGADLSAVSVTVTATIGAATVISGRSLASPFGLAAGATRSLAGSISLPGHQGDTVRTTFAVIATGPLGNTVSDSVNGPDVQMKVVGPG